MSLLKTVKKKIRTKKLPEMEENSALRMLQQDKTHTALTFKIFLTKNNNPVLTRNLIVHSEYQVTFICFARSNVH